MTSKPLVVAVVVLALLSSSHVGVEVRAIHGYDFSLFLRLFRDLLLEHCAIVPVRCALSLEHACALAQHTPILLEDAEVA